MQHINLKLFAEPHSRIDLQDAIPVFHRWIQNRVCPEMLIDVADYKHVPSGPGVLLIGHEANYSLDLGGARLGILYARKALADGDAARRLRQAYAAAVAAAERLEHEPEFAGKLRFSRKEIQITLNDRLLFPNTAETWSAVAPDLTHFLDEVLGPARYAVERALDPRERFRVTAAVS